MEQMRESATKVDSSRAQIEGNFLCVDSADGGRAPPPPPATSASDQECIDSVCLPRRISHRIWVVY
jgi:hypothetical protein